MLGPLKVIHFDSFSPIMKSVSSRLVYLLAVFLTYMFS